MGALKNIWCIWLTVGDESLDQLWRLTTLLGLFCGLEYFWVWGCGRLGLGSRGLGADERWMNFCIADTTKNRVLSPCRLSSYFVVGSNICLLATASTAFHFFAAHPSTL